MVNNIFAEEFWEQRKNSFNSKVAEYISNILLVYGEDGEEETCAEEKSEIL